MYRSAFRGLGITAVLVAAGLTFTGAAIAATGDTQYLVHNLTSDGPPNTADHTDAHLVNAWGLVASPTSPWWVSDNGTSLSTLYNAAGVPNAGVVVSVPSDPTGIVWNGTSTAFQIGTPAKAASFIFDTEGGGVYGWNGGTAATVEVPAANSAEFKGLAIATAPAGPQLYATDFHNGTVDVFSSTWHLVPGGFVDPNLPAGYAPFGIQTIGSTIYVTYAKTQAGSGDEADGPGLGLVDAYDLSGNLVARVASTGGVLNAPWGLAQAPANFGAYGGDLLVGNFGDGRINAFKKNADGSYSYDGTLQAFPSGNPLVVDGLWALEFGNGSLTNNGPTSTLFFTAGPDGENHGLFGDITANPTTVGGSVASQLALTINPTVSLGAFVPGVAATYSSTATADVVSTAQTTTLTVADLSGLGTPGFLFNSTPPGFSLATALKASATSTGAGAAGSTPASISASPLTLVSYSQPISNDMPTITFAQAIGANDPLRTGTYTKTLTFTLSTTTP